MLWIIPKDARLGPDDIRRVPIKGIPLRKLGPMSLAIYYHHL